MTVDIFISKSWFAIETDNRMGQCEIKGSVKSLSLRETRDLELLLINECPLTSPRKAQGGGSCSWKIVISFIVYKTLLDLHSKTELQQSPKQLK